jgi:tRNA-dependent cyclodipeptide synthase
MNLYILLGLASAIFYLLRRYFLWYIPDCGASLSDVNFDGISHSQKYGKVYRMSGVTTKFPEPVVVIADLEIAKLFYRDHLQHRRDRDFSLNPTIECMLGDAIGTKSGKDWTKHHRAMKFMLTPSFLEYWRPSIQEIIHDHLTNLFLEDLTKPLNTNSYDLVLRIMTRVLYGNLTLIQQIELDTIASYHLNLLSKKWNSKQTLKAFQVRWNTFNTDVMANTQDPNTGLYYLQKSECTHQEILSNLDELLLFNIDVMYTAMSALAVNYGRYGHLLKPELLNKFVNESARCDPSLYLSFPERTATASMIGDYFVPENTLVVIDACSINSASFTLTHNTEFHRFGLGPRKCLGRKFADAILEEYLRQLSSRATLTVAPCYKKEKTEGLCFFTPYTEYPPIYVKEYSAAVLIGLSLGNSFYNSENIPRLLQQWQYKTHRIITFVPAEPSIHTYMAKNPNGNRVAVAKKCRQYATHIHKIVEKCNQKNVENCKWLDLIALNPTVYDTSMTKIFALYQQHTEFRRRIDELTLGVIGMTGDLAEGVKFILKELAFIVVAPEILGEESVIYSYHRDFPIVADLVEGRLGYPRVWNVYSQIVD